MRGLVAGSIHVSQKERAAEAILAPRRLELQEDIVPVVETVDLDDVSKIVNKLVQTIAAHSVLFRNPMQQSLKRWVQGHWKVWVPVLDLGAATTPGLHLQINVDDGEEEIHKRALTFKLLLLLNVVEETGELDD